MLLLLFAKSHLEFNNRVDQCSRIFADHNHIHPFLSIPVTERTKVYGKLEDNKKHQTTNLNSFTQTSTECRDKRFNAIDQPTLAQHLSYVCEFKIANKQYKKKTTDHSMFLFSLFTFLVGCLHVLYSAHNTNPFSIPFIFLRLSIYYRFEVTERESSSEQIIFW